MGKLSAGISNFILRVLGWKITGRYAKEIKKKVLIVVPHTSAWDFPLGLLVRATWKDQINYVGKDSLFKGPLGWFFRSTGGVPVDRSKSQNFVDAVVEIFNTREQFNLTLAPEGTRKRVEKLKTGFYFIAKQANVPIQMIRFNFGEKKVEIRDLFYVSGNFEKDMKVVNDYFRGVLGKRPENSFL